MLSYGLITHIDHRK